MMTDLQCVVIVLLVTFYFCRDLIQMFLAIGEREDWVRDQAELQKERHQETHKLIVMQDFSD